MSSYEEQELKRLESALADLAPRPAALDRDRLLFEAGRRSVRPTLFWPLTTLVMTAIAALLTVALLSQPVRPPISHVIPVPVKAGHSESTPATGPEIAPAPPAPPSDFSSDRK